MPVIDETEHTREFKKFRQDIKEMIQVLADKIVALEKASKGK